MTSDMRPLKSMMAAGFFIVAVLGTAQAQEPGSRAEEQARQQEEKARALKAYKGPWIERQLLAIEKAGGFGVARGLFVTFGDIKRGSGFALGPAYGKTFASGAVVVAKGAYAFSHAKVAQLSVQSPALAGRRLLFKARGRWQDAPTVRVYGLGMDSPKTKTEYSETKTELSGEAALAPVRFLRMGAGVGLERFETGISHKADPAHMDIFDGLPGVGADPRYVHGLAYAAIDSRDGQGYSRRGSLLQATLHDYRQQNDGPYSFQRVDGAAEQYVPILHGNWVLFFGLRASTTATTGGHAVPFFLMPDLGGHDLRGFANYRFRDLHSIAITAEYRWYAQEYLDGAIFYDAGKTVPTRGALDFTGLKSSIGAGIRLHGPQTTAIRLEVAHSREGMRLLLKFSPVGQ
jgi:hypothetical protein